MPAGGIESFPSGVLFSNLAQDISRSLPHDPQALEVRLAIERDILRQTIRSSGFVRTLNEETSIWEVPHVSFATDCAGKVAFVAEKTKEADEYKALTADCNGCEEVLPWTGISLSTSELRTMQEEARAQRRFSA